jgi:hypothetical protein
MVKFSTGDQQLNDVNWDAYDTGDWRTPGNYRNIADFDTWLLEMGPTIVSSIVGKLVEFAVSALLFEAGPEGEEAAYAAADMAKKAVKAYLGTKVEQYQQDVDNSISFAIQSFTGYKLTKEDIQNLEWTHEDRDKSDHYKFVSDDEIDYILQTGSKEEVRDLMFYGTAATRTHIALDYMYHSRIFEKDLQNPGIKDTAVAKGYDRDYTQELVDSKWEERHENEAQWYQDNALGEKNGLPQRQPNLPYTFYNRDGQPRNSHPYEFLKPESGIHQEIVSDGPYTTVTITGFPDGRKIEHSTQFGSKERSTTYYGVDGSVTHKIEWDKNGQVVGAPPLNTGKSSHTEEVTGYDPKFPKPSSSSSSSSSSSTYTPMEEDKDEEDGSADVEETEDDAVFINPVDELDGPYVDEVNGYDYPEMVESTQYMKPSPTLARCTMGTTDPNWGKKPSFNPGFFHNYIESEGLHATNQMGLFSSL